jgi:hypothetical protein
VLSVVIGGIAATVVTSDSDDAITLASNDVGKVASFVGSDYTITTVLLSIAIQIVLKYAQRVHRKCDLLLIRPKVPMLGRIFT